MAATPIINIADPGADEANLRAYLLARLGNRYGTTLVADTTLTSDHLSAIVPVQTGASTITITLPDAGVGSDGGSIFIMKSDDAAGIVRIVDENGEWMEDLYCQGEFQMLAPDVDGDGWLPMMPKRARRRPPGSRLWPPFPEAGGGGSSAAIAVDTIYLHPIDLQEPRWIDALAMNIMAGQAALNIKTALYDWSPSSPADPSGATLLASGAQISATIAQGSAISTFTAVKLKRHGRAWAAFKSGGSWASTSNQVFCCGSIIAAIGGDNGREFGGFTSDPIFRGWSVGSQAFANAFPATLPTASKVTTNIVPLLLPRVL